MTSLTAARRARPLTAWEAIERANQLRRQHEDDEDDVVARLRGENQVRPLSKRPEPDRALKGTQEVIVCMKNVRRIEAQIRRHAGGGP